MKSTQVNSEIKETRAKMEALKACMKDKSISAADRKQYYSAYLSSASYLLQLEVIKPDHNLTIA